MADQPNERVRELLNKLSNKTPYEQRENLTGALMNEFVGQGDGFFTGRHNAESYVGFLCAIPEDAKTAYVHISHIYPEKNPFVQELQTRYGADNVLVTVAPSKSYQSFYDDSLDKSAKEKKRKMVIDPFENFSAKKSIDAVIYLCQYLCDGYQDPYFPDQITTEWHIWPAIRSAEQLQKPLIVGAKDADHCYSGTIGRECYVRKYITGTTRYDLVSSTKEKIKCPTTIVRI